jgi:hypothetical protein
MMAYKLFTQASDGTLYPLFIDKGTAVPVRQWVTSKCVPTKGYAVRHGWHACLKPVAPHLSLHPKGKRKRVWCSVELSGQIDTIDKPQAHGGQWLIASRMRVIALHPHMVGVTYDNK